MKGILIIACGHGWYGKMSAALAATIRTKSDIPIHLAYAGNGKQLINDNELKLFNSISEIPAAYYTWKGKVAWIRTKMFINQLSPFDETLYLDCDLLWTGKAPEEYFNQLEPYELTFSNFGKTDTLWASLKEVREVYGEGEYYTIHSEFIYFKKTGKVKEWFDKALEVYDNLKVKHTVFADAIPDELAFSIAGALTRTYPHKENFRPIFWGKADKKRMLQVHEICNEYAAISMAGNNASNYMMLVYNILSKAAYQKLKLQNSYSWKQKRSFLKERKKY
jgi:hypothetical protein